MKISRPIFTTVVILLLACLGVLHAFYPLPYVFDVMVHQGPDYDDFERFPASVISPSEVASRLPVAPDESVVDLIESFSDIADLDDFIASTETTALLVVHQGNLILERYGLGHDSETVENVFSVSKSLTSALVGIAAAEGFFRVEDPITDYLPELGERDPRFEAITIENLLDMVAGIAYSRDIKFPIINNDDPLVYYHPDLASVILRHPQIESPPGTFRYSNYNPPLLGLILRRTTGVSASEYFEQKIWQPMGASRPAGWTVDKKGFERMESGFHARARDLARFGLLYLNQGQVGDRQVVPHPWVAASTDSRTPNELETYNGRQWDYRAGWWILPRPEGRSDYCGIGHFGQFICVSPQHDAVFVRNGPGRGEWSDFDWTELFYFLAERLSERGGARDLR